MEAIVGAVERSRVHLRANVVTRPLEPAFAYRHPERRDCESLGSLMLSAYRGTIDERHKIEDEAIEHIAKYFSGEFGKPLLGCSYVAHQEELPVSVALVSMDGDEPLLAQLYTVPEWKNRGLASALIQLSMNALIENGFGVLNLMVTDGNEAAAHVYRKLGFEPFSEENA